MVATGRPRPEGVTGADIIAFRSALIDLGLPGRISRLQRYYTRTSLVAGGDERGQHRYIRQCNCTAPACMLYKDLIWRSGRLDILVLYGINAMTLPSNMYTIR